MSSMPDPYLSGTERDPIKDERPPGVLQPTERGQDPLREDLEHNPEAGSGATRDEEEVVQGEIARTQRVYAPPSERVPREPLPGHRDLVEHPDAATPERQAAGETGSTGGTYGQTPGSPQSAWSSIRSSAGRDATTPLADADRPSSWSSSPTAVFDHDSGSFPLNRRTGFGIGAGWLVLIGGGIGVWLYLKRRREQNRPINRLRRQAYWAASELRGRVPSTDEMMRAVQAREEVVKPAASVAAMMLSLAIVMLRRMRQQNELERELELRRGEARDRFGRFADRARDLKWQERLGSLRNGGMKLPSR